MKQRIVPAVIAISITLLTFSSEEGFPAGVKKPLEKLPAAIPADKEDNCVICHEKLDDRLKRPVDLWMAGVHYRAKGSCNMCHGGNSAAVSKKNAKTPKDSYIGTPDRYTLTASCGRGGCHSDIIAYFRSGPHYQTLLSKNEPDCTLCHGSHNVKKPNIDIIKQKACYDCHEEQNLLNIISRLMEVDKKFKAVQGHIDYLKGKHAPLGSVVDDFKKTRNMYIRLIHQSSKDDVKSYMSILEFGTKNLEGESNLKVSLIKRLDLLYIIMVTFGISIIAIFCIYALYMYSKRPSRG